MAFPSWFCASLLLNTPIPSPPATSSHTLDAAATVAPVDEVSDNSPVAPKQTPATAPGTRLEWRNGSPALVFSPGGTTFRPLAQLIVDAETTSGAREATRNRSDRGVRAAHLGFAGTVANHLVYQLETEFASGSADVLWAYVGWRGTVAGIGVDMLAGNLQNDRSVEGSSGGEALPFAEPNFVASAIAPDRGGFGFGAQSRLIDNRWHASFAVTGNDIDANHPQTGNRTLLARAHWNPVKREGAILHVGAWTFDEKFTGGTRTLGADTNVAHGLNLRTVLPSPPLIGTTGDRGAGVEAGGVLGSVWVMGEVGRRVIDLPRVEPHITAKSRSAGWFLTGDAPPYAAATGGFGRPIVHRTVFQGGSGQVELTARYKDIRFTMPGFRNSGSSVTGGVNWYLSSQMRLMGNVSAWRMAPDQRMTGTGTGPDHGTTFVLRAQFVL